MREVEDEQFFRRIADRARVVHYQRFARDAFQQVSGRDVADVERRILAHQHHVDVLSEVEHDGRAGGEMVAFDASHRDGTSVGAHAAVLVAEILRKVMKQAVSALLCLQHQRKGGIAGNPDRFERIHLDGYGQGHRRSRLSECVGFVTRARHWEGGGAGGVER